MKADFFLKKYGITLTENETAEEKLRHLTAAFDVQESYEGDKPYIFISYAHVDSALVLPAIKAIQAQGYPVWYDAGIRVGSEWAADIAEHLRAASLVIAFISKASIGSPHCRSEIAYAFNNGKPILTVKLDQEPMPAGMEMQLSLWPDLCAYAYDDGDACVAELVNAPIIAEYISPVLKAYYEKKRREAAAAEQKRQAAEAAERKRHAEEEAERRRQEAERKRLEAESAERKRREAELAEEAERKRREAESAARVRRAVEEQAQQRKEKEALERKRREAEKAERERREAEMAERKRFEQEKAEHERWKAEQKRLREEQNRLRADKEAKTRQQAEYEKRRAVQKEKMEQVYSQIRKDLSKKRADGYESAIRMFNRDLKPYIIPGLSLEKDLEDYKQRFCDTIYHDARSFEENKNDPMAYELYRALPENYADAHQRSVRIKAAWETKGFTWLWVTLALFLVANYVLTRYVYAREASFWIKLLISVAPAFVAVNVFSVRVFRWYRASVTFRFLAVYILCSVICLIMDPFLYPDMPVRQAILTSLGFNVAALAVGVACFEFWQFVSSEFCEYMDQKIQDA